MPVRRHVDHTSTPSTTASSGSSGATAARRDDRQPGRGARRPPDDGLGAGPDRRVVPEDDGLDPPVEDVGEASGSRRRPPAAGRRPAGPARAAGSPSGSAASVADAVGAVRPARGGPRPDAPRRRRTRPEPLGHRPRPGRSAAPADGGRRPPRARPARGSRSVPRVAAGRRRRPGSRSTSRSSSSRVIASGSVVSTLAPDGPPAAPAGGRDERGEGPLRAGHDGQPARSLAADLEAGQRIGAPIRRGRGPRPGPGPRPASARAAGRRRARRRRRPASRSGRCQPPRAKRPGR